ncbi:Hypothetical predicted protein [Podarcis lilfordi]|uniref:Uncharacterized protein n=1 Tax=Podarcis lilfordi TaxID=74358 RepID=A0AA35JXT9_9SAUR|nr:Hypothetical predicted protein [Podarcis lilfordi]
MLMANPTSHFKKEREREREREREKWHGLTYNWCLPLCGEENSSIAAQRGSGGACVGVQEWGVPAGQAKKHNAAIY